MLFLFRNKSEGSRTAAQAKDRLDYMLMQERGQNIHYLDSLTQDITRLVKQYAKTPHIVVHTSANRNNTLDIRVHIGKSEG